MEPRNSQRNTEPGFAIDFELALGFASWRRFELGGTMPEDLPVPEEDLKKLERRVKSTGKRVNSEGELTNKLENGE